MTLRRASILAGVVLAAIAVTVGVIVGSARSDGGPYKVRAIFDDASFAVTGEDVRVAGANVGTISGLGVTPGKRAAVTLTISDGRFTPFFANAHCAIRPQSLIGEEYVDCTPGSSSAAPLAKIRSGPGKGSSLLPVTRTSSPVDTDIVQDISREPVRQSLAVIIDELGTGLAARGSDLNAVIHRANPALGNTDKVVKILARQNRVLAQLATNSDQVLAPLARERRQLAGFITNANTTAQASASQAADIDRTFRRFPGFLRQLRPLMTDLGQLSDEGTPVMQDLGSSAAPLGQEFAQLTPFARSARTALVNLGAATKQAQPALVATEPLARRLDRLGAQGRPAAASLQKLLGSLNSTGGIEQFMNLLYEGVSVGNGFDSLGHYVRLEPLTTSCTDYQPRSSPPACSANFDNSASADAVAGSAAGATSAPATAASVRSAALSSGSQAIVARALRSVGAHESAGSSMSGLLHYLMGGN